MNTSRIATASGDFDVRGLSLSELSMLARSFDGVFAPVVRQALADAIGGDQRPDDLPALLTRAWANVPAMVEALINVAIVAPGPFAADLPLPVRLEALGAAARHTVERNGLAAIGTTLALAVILPPRAAAPVVAPSPSDRVN